MSPRIMRAADALSRIGLYAAELAVVAMLALINIEIVTRSFFNFSILIVDETCGYLVVAMLFLGVTYSLRQGALLRVDFLIRRLGVRARAGVSLVYDVLSLIFACVLGYELYRVTVSSFMRDMVSPTLMQTPIYIPQIVMPVGMALLSVGLVAEILRDVAELTDARGSGSPAHREDPHLGPMA